MALSTTSFNHESIATKVKMAINEAAWASHRQAYVYNRHGMPILSVRYYRGGGFRFYVGSRELTDIVFDGLKAYHAKGNK